MKVQTSRGKECISVVQRTDSLEFSLMTKPHFVRAAAGWKLLLNLIVFMLGPI